MRRMTAVLILVLVAGLLWVSRGSTPADPAPAPAASPAAQNAVAPPGVDTIDFGDADCDDAGYLCIGMHDADPARAIRWPDGTGTLTVRVPVPPDLDAATARRLQRQAAAGIREWQGHPLPLRVESGRDTESVDIDVRWVRSMEEDRVGQATVRWRAGPGGAHLAVTDFVLASHTPDGRPIDPRRLRLTAAHEMGHALGLPHSDDPNDVMYPYNTATRLTYRDFRTLEVLYGLPAGATILFRP